MTHQERKKALGSLIFLKEKTDGTIKARAVADGRSQRETATKGDASSPTVSIEAVLLTAAIEASEHRDVAVVDIPNAFIQTEMEGEKVVMKLRGALAELLVKTAPELYSKYTTDENGRTVLYVELLKALYGCLMSALLFYRKLLKDLTKLGFVVNPYDPCVANKMVAGKQMTVTWHVDDLKVSHVDSKRVDNFIKWVKDTFTNDGVGEVRVSCGKIHQYLGMELTYCENGTVKVGMTDYIKNMVDEFQEEIKGTAATPAQEHLFSVDESDKKLDKDHSAWFHTAVANGLFACKRARPDIQLAIAFLSTRVKEPAQDDWNKLVRLLKYLNGTRELVLTLSVDELRMLKWYVDVSYGVNNDCRSHTGSILSLGKGGVTNGSIKQKLNVKSSTEGELVGTDDVLPQVLWTNYFLEAQGFKTNGTVMYQDNLSTIQMLKNGKASSTKRTKHINIRYYFITDRIQNGELTIEHCPTERMVADFFTKPLQGTKFIEFRKEIMNL